MELLDLLFAFGIGWFGGQMYLSWQLKKRMEKVCESLGIPFGKYNIEDITEVKVSRVPKMFTEYQGNSVYLYNKETGSFVCQAGSLEELAKIVNKEYTAAVVFDKEQKIIFHDGKIQPFADETKTS